MYIYSRAFLKQIHIIIALTYFRKLASVGSRLQASMTTTSPQPWTRWELPQHSNKPGENYLTPAITQVRTTSTKPLPGENYLNTTN